jgi:hypothetical protein
LRCVDFQDAVGCFCCCFWVPDCHVHGMFCFLLEFGLGGSVILLDSSMSRDTS